MLLKARVLPEQGTLPWLGLDRSLGSRGSAPGMAAPGPSDLLVRIDREDMAARTSCSLRPRTPNAESLTRGMASVRG